MFNLLKRLLLLCRRPTNDEDSWPTYARTTPQFFTWNTESLGRIGMGPRATACAFWNQFMPRITEAHGESNFKTKTN